MINTILSQITGLFQKDFLFASFLPTLILLSWVAGIVIGVFGIEYVFSAYGALGAPQQAGLATLTTLMTIVTAYLLNALRGTFIRVWSGESSVFNAIFLGPIKLAEMLQSRRFLKLRSLSQGNTTWLDLAEEFREATDKFWDAKRDQPGFWMNKWIMVRAKTLHRRMSESTTRAKLNDLAMYFNSYSGESLKPHYQHVRRELIDWAEKDRYALQRCSAILDRSFGTVATIRATSLGNVIEAYNHYGYKRYCMEAELFWPRLKKVIPDDYMAQVREPKILLDFAVTMATISVVLALGLLTVGPWLWFDFRFWGTISAVQLVAAGFFYFLSVDAATHYGDMIRSCFDLFRLDLLKQLQFKRPTLLTEERTRWEKISQLIVYGQETSLEIRAEDSE
ncbi:MAG: hypothetical protein V3T55_06020 [Anaerolineales bacterium]